MSFQILFYHVDVEIRGQHIRRPISQHVVLIPCVDSRQRDEITWLLEMVMNRFT